MPSKDVLRAKLKQANSLYTFKPAGLTRYLQLLDTSVNKDFKNYIRKEYLNYQVENKQLTKVKKQI